MQSYHTQPTGTIGRPDRPEWTAANGIGTAGEQVVAAVFKNIGLAATKMIERSADLQVVGKIEVKTDRHARRTGNVAVETMYRNRPSGINTTAADTWAFVLIGTGEILLIGTERLRAAIASLPDTPAGEGASVRLLRVDELRRRAVSVGGGVK